MKIFVEAEWDSRRGVVQLSATTGFGLQSYRVELPAHTPDEARDAALSFARMYQGLGAEVVA